MKTNIFLFLLLVSITLFANQSLVMVKGLGDIKYEVPVLEVVDDDYFLILAEKKDLELLSEKRFDAQILDNTVEGKNYYLVFPFFENPNEVIPYSESIMKKYGTVLQCFDGKLLMESTAERLHSMTEYRVKLDYIELEPMNFNISNNTIIINKPTVFNSALQSMLDKVNPDSVEAFERKLCGFTTRHAKSTCSKNEFIPWMKQIYKQYGCDTVISIPMTGYSDELIGVRYGKKNPSIKKFTLLGGHSDVIISGANVETKHQGGNDNTTGQVAVLEACRVHQGYWFEITILYCTFNAEEVGLVGSRYTTDFLQKQGCQSLGGNFSYDMFGMSESAINFKVKNTNPGAQEFVTKMSELKKLYKLTQPVSIAVSSSGITNSDVKNMDAKGFTCVGHNFAMAGSGGIHSAKDIITPSYDKVFQAECAKLGIITTAEYAVVIPSSIKDNSIVTKSIVQFIQNPTSVQFVFNGKVHVGKLEIYDLRGKLLKTLHTDESTTRLVWDKSTTNGLKIAMNSIVVAKYSTPTHNSMIKFVLK
jgi:hypothetical protein